MDIVDEALPERSYKILDERLNSYYKHWVMLSEKYDEHYSTGHELVGYNDKAKAEALVAFLELLDSLEDAHNDYFLSEVIKAINEDLEMFTI